ncbi:hypothetical protein CRUP_031775, partial [Coryphaenoides rupestris]
FLEVIITPDVDLVEEYLGNGAAAHQLLHHCPQLRVFAQIHISHRHTETPQSGFGLHTVRATLDGVYEAKEAIVSYTNNAAELLKRRKVHRDVIFKYLAKEGVVMPPNSDKHQLVQRTFELWTSGRTLHLLLSWVFSQSVFERREGEE